MERVLCAALVVGLIAVDFTTVKTVRACVRVTGLRLLMIMQMVGTAVVAVMVVLPLVNGGLQSDLDDFVAGLLLSLAIGFLSTCVLVMTLFDIARFERSEQDLGDLDSDPIGVDPQMALPAVELAASPGEVGEA